MKFYFIFLILFFQSFVFANDFDLEFEVIIPNIVEDLHDKIREYGNLSGLCEYKIHVSEKESVSLSVSDEGNVLVELPISLEKWICTSVSDVLIVDTHATVVLEMNYHIENNEAIVFNLSIKDIDASYFQIFGLLQFNFPNLGDVLEKISLPSFSFFIPFSKSGSAISISSSNVDLFLIEIEEKTGLKINLKMALNIKL